MARIRTIKPDFFFDEDLSKLSPHTRLFFIGLWNHADREGRGEDRPVKLKALIFPYEELDGEKMMKALTPHFVVRYLVDGKKYFQIVNFKKHQYPNIKEAESTIPPPPGIGLHHNGTVPAPYLNHTDTLDKGKGTGTVTGREGKGRDKTTAAPSAVDSSEEYEMTNEELLQMQFPYGAMKGVHVANIPADQAAFILKQDKRLGKQIKKALQLRVKIKADECRK